MAITAYVGLPGAGKSFEVVNGPILRAIEAGRVVWTNIPCNIPGVRVVEGEEAQGHWYLQAPPGSLCAIDECWRYWAAGTKADQIPEDQKEWFAMHRHRTDGQHTTDIALVTQDLAQVASFVRNLVERTYRMEKLTALGLRDWYKVQVYHGAVTGQKPPEAQRQATFRRKYSPEGFKRYKSHTQGAEAKEVMIDKRGGLLTRPAVLLIPLAIIGILAIPKVIGSTVSNSTEAKPATAERSESVPVRPVPPPIPTPTPQPEVPQVTASAPAAAQDDESKRWTLVGVITRADGSGVAILQNMTGRRRVPVEDHCTSNGWEWTCEVDGQRIAMWTGNSVAALTQGSTYNRTESQ